MEFDRSKKYYKVTNESEIHNGYQFVDGLNVDTQEWNTEKCSKGGIYFTNADNIGSYLYYSDKAACWIREVTIPENEQFISLEGDKIKTKSIILGERKRITIELLKSFNVSDIVIACWAIASNADIETVKILLNIAMPTTLNITECGSAIIAAAQFNRREIIEMILNLAGDSIRPSNLRLALTTASMNNHLDIVKYIIQDLKADPFKSIYEYDDIFSTSIIHTPFLCTIYRDRLDIAKYMLDTINDISTKKYLIESICRELISLKCVYFNHHEDAMYCIFDKYFELTKDIELIIDFAVKTNDLERIKYIMSRYNITTLILYTRRINLPDGTDENSIAINNYFTKELYYKNPETISFNMAFKGNPRNNIIPSGQGYVGDFGNLTPIAFGAGPLRPAIASFTRSEPKELELVDPGNPIKIKQEEEQND